LEGCNKVELANRTWISKTEKVLGAKKGLVVCLETPCCLHCSFLHFAKDSSLQTGSLWQKWGLFLSFRARREPGGKKEIVQENNTLEIHKWKISWDILFLIHIRTEK